MTGVTAMSNEAISAQATPQETLGRNEKKWGKAVMRSGWTAVPTVLLEKQHALSLTPTDVNVLLQLMKYWWNADDPPFPSKAAIAEAMGVAPRTVQRRITYMESLGLISRRKRPGPFATNAILFDGLIRKLEPFAQEMAAEREERARGKRERRQRKRAQPGGGKS
jgi:hypothetical protein